MSEDRKFKFEDGRFVNRVSGEPIPDVEPVILSRARDRHALALLRHYQLLVSDPHHQQAVQDRIDEFAAYQAFNPQRIKEPGITRHIELNKDRGAQLDRLSDDGERARMEQILDEQSKRPGLRPSQSTKGDTAK